MKQLVQDPGKKKSYLFPESSNGLSEKVNEVIIIMLLGLEMD